MQKIIPRETRLVGMVEGCDQGTASPIHPNPPSKTQLPSARQRRPSPPWLRADHIKHHLMRNRAGLVWTQGELREVLSGDWARGIRVRRTRNIQANPTKTHIKHIFCEIWRRRMWERRMEVRIKGCSCSSRGKTNSASSNSPRQSPKVIAMSYNWARERHSMPRLRATIAEYCPRLTYQVSKSKAM